MSKLTSHAFAAALACLGLTASTAPGQASTPSRTPESRNAQDAPDLAVLESAYLENGEFLPALRGFWQLRGYGKFVAITARRARLHTVTQAGAWHSDQEDDGLLAAVSADGRRARITPHPRVPGYFLERVQALPAACGKPTTWTPPRVFDAFAATMTELYPFFAVRKIDWAARIRVQRPKLNPQSTDAELFRACEAMLAGLGDGHVALSATIDGKEQLVGSQRVDTFRRIRQAFEAQTAVSSGRAFHQAWVDTFKAELNACMVGGKVHFACKKKLVWGRVTEDIGYLFLTGMGGYADGDLATQIAALHSGLDTILKELRDTKGMIVDVSLNHGGMDLFSMEIADHFADRKRLGYSKYPATAKDLILHRFIAPRPGGTSYVKPVFLIIDSPTASAAEIFTMCMRALPHVTTVGQPTAGALSDVLDMELPNGWEFGMSNEVYLDHEGKCHEGPGVPPDVVMDIFDPKDITRHGHAEALRHIAGLVAAKAAQRR